MAYFVQSGKPLWGFTESSVDLTLLCLMGGCTKVGGQTYIPLERVVLLLRRRTVLCVVVFIVPVNVQRESSTRPACRSLRVTLFFTADDLLLADSLPCVARSERVKQNNAHLLLQM